MNKDVTRRDDIPQLIGQPRAPIKKVPKNKKEHIKTWIENIRQPDDSAAPELLLRAYLSIGNSPPPQTLEASTIIDALKLEDILRFAKKLCLSSQTIEASALFAALQTALQDSVRLHPPLGSIRKIIPNLNKWLEWVDSSQASLTEATEIGLLDLLSLAISSTAHTRRLSGKQSDKAKKMIIPFLDLLFRVVAKSTYIETFTRAMKQLETVKSNFSSSFLELILEDERRHQLLEKTLERMPIYVRKAAYDGRVDRIEAVAMGASVIPGGNSRFLAVIREIWNEGVGKLTDEIQELLRGYLKIDEGIIPKSITFADRSEDLRIPQMAVALLSSWEAREDSPRAAESFKVLNSVAQRFFNLRICGQVGSVVKFDSRVHEFPRTPIGEGQVMIVRPWVEWVDGSCTKVIIRAVVEKVKEF